MNEEASRQITNEERKPTSRSLRSLDGLNFFLADVRDGMGPFLGAFSREAHKWDAGRVGMVLAASQVGTVLMQTPAGALIDRIRAKRLAVVLAAQAVIGAAATIFPPAVAARSLGLVGRAAMPRRTGRNEAFNHGGNVVGAALAGGAAYFLGYGAMFLVVAGFATASVVAALSMREAISTTTSHAGPTRPAASPPRPRGSAPSSATGASSSSPRRP